MAGVSSERASFPPPSVEEYRIVRPLGQGRSGRVFLAHDTLLDRPVAIKFIPAVSQAQLARFVVEARATARIQHPNVVTLYRVGQLEEAAYLASEYVRGVGLERLKKPIPWAKVLTLARGLTRGLAAAHRRGVLHRDIKPHNALLTEGGEVKLLDFGLAAVSSPQTQAEATTEARAPEPEGGDASELERLITLATSLEVSGSRPLVGTPHYMSPEAWRGEEHTARSDLYSLGAVLFELLTGHPPTRAPNVAELRRAVQERPAPPVRSLVPDVPADLAELIDACLATDPLQRPSSAQQALDVLEALSTPGAAAQPGVENPYRGLRAFDAEHRVFFFGRRRDVAQIRERLKSDGCVVLTGDSGVGKSSLAAAGVLPAIVDGALDDGRSWKVTRMVPGRRPLLSLAEALAPPLGVASSVVERWLKENPRQLSREVQARLGKEGGLLIYLDQLEELVTLAPADEAAEVGVAIAPLCAGTPGVRVLASARSDFLSRLAAVEAFGEVIARSIYLVRSLSPEDVRDAIVGPARLLGVRFESDQLVETLVESTRHAEGALPLLQFTLAQLWQARDVEKNVIGASALDRLGGVSGALARHADATVDSLPAAQRRDARTLMLRLVTADGTRARKTAEELSLSDPGFLAALEALVRARLVVAREAPGGAEYEISHEALMVGWSTLARWIAEDARDADLRRRVETAALDWARLNHRADALWGPGALAEAERLAPDVLSERERQFLTASRRRVRRQRMARRAAAGLVVLGLLATVAVVRLIDARARQRQVDALVAQASEILDRARAVAADQVQRREAAFDLYRQGELARGDAAFAESQEIGGRADRLFAEVTDVLERALALSPQDPGVREAGATLAFDRATRAEADGEPALRDVFVQRLRTWGEGGPLWAAWTAPARVELEHADGATLALRRFERQPDGDLTTTPVEIAGPPLTLPPGSYLLEAVRAGHVPVRHPFVVGRGETLRLSLQAPRIAEVPEGFVYVPEGRFLFGSTSEAGIRHFLNAPAAHARRVPAFLISAHEVTWREYLRYLDALEPAERATRTPRLGNTSLFGQLGVRKQAGKWVLSIKPTEQVYTVAEGELLRYPGRTHRQAVDWSTLPVVGVTFDDAVAYARWAAARGGVPGARLCTEAEWERAARGADTREYPHGDRLNPDDANFDVTYGKAPLAFGPDPVGSHPASRSVFGVDDLAGNVWEWTTGVLPPGRAVARGGSYYFAASTARATNRESPEPAFRDVTVGFRMCSDHPSG